MTQSTYKENKLKNRPNFTIKKTRKIVNELNECKINADNRHKCTYLFDDISSESPFPPSWQSRRRIVRIKKRI